MPFSWPQSGDGQVQPKAEFMCAVLFCGVLKSMRDVYALAATELCHETAQALSEVVCRLLMQASAERALEH